MRVVWAQMILVHIFYFLGTFRAQSTSFNQGEVFNSDNHWSEGGSQAAYHFLSLAFLESNNQDIIVIQERQTYFMKLIILF